MSNFRSVVIIASLGATVGFSSLSTHSVVATNAVRERPATVDPLPTPQTKAPYSSYRKVSIGMTADEVRKTLGDPRDKSDAEDFYVFSEKETMQIVYEANHKVDAISITFYSELEKAPPMNDVVGPKAETKPDGSVFKMVRHEKAGFWVSYSKTAGDSPTITVTLKKI